MNMTEMLHMKDCYLKEFDTEVTLNGESGGEFFVILDKTCFYPEGGGQFSDNGKLICNGKEIEVYKVSKGSGVVKFHGLKPVASIPTALGESQQKTDNGSLSRTHGTSVKHWIKEQIPIGSKVHGMINWERRHKLMRLHTAQHIISGLILDEFGAETVGNQIREIDSRLDVKPFKWKPELKQQIEKKFNEIIDKKLDVKIDINTREQMLQRCDVNRRKLFERLPTEINEIRIVDVPGVDVCPCAGTHVKNTSEIGHLDIIKTDNKGAETTRIEFKLV